MKIMKMHNAKYLIREGFHNLWTNRTMTLASVAVLISCLLLTGAAMLFSQNMGTAMKKLEGSNSITVYLDEDMPVLEAVQVGETLRSIENVKDCSYVSKDEALESMMELLGDDGTVLQGLSGDDNFLPDSYDISMKDLTKYDETIKEIKAVDGVSQITDYSDVADKLTRIDNLVATAGMWIVLLLGIVSLFIIANTIRVTMFSRRMEISIMKSVGATNWFVRLPVCGRRCHDWADCRYLGQRPLILDVSPDGRRYYRDFVVLYPGGIVTVSRALYPGVCCWPGWPLALWGSMISIGPVPESGRREQH